MAKVIPFKGIRPTVEKCSKIAALPYDVYNREEAKEVVSKNPDSFLAIDRAETSFPDDVDTYDERVYKKAHDMLWDRIEKGDFVMAQSSVMAQAQTAEQEKPKKVFEKAIPEDIQYVVDNWGIVKRHISNPYKTFLQDAKFSVKGEDTLLIVFNAGDIGYEGCDKPEVIEMLNTLISEEIKKQVKVEMKMLETHQNFGDYFQEVVGKINMDIEEEEF